MAGVTRQATRRPSEPPATSVGTDLQAAPRPATPRAVRVSVARVMSHLDAPPIVVDRGEAILVDGQPAAVGLERLPGQRAILTTADEGISGRRAVLMLSGAPSPDNPGGVEREVVVDGWRIVLVAESERRADLRARATRGRESVARSGPTEIRAIIPGRILSVSVAAGDVVEAGQQLLLVEAMKMQNELRAPREGTVERVAVGPGDTIELGDLLVVLA